MSKLKQKGQGLVEFALILPLLLLMFFGIVEFGRIFQAYMTVQHAAREAARYAVTGQGGATMAERVRSIKERAVETTAGINVGNIDYRECLDPPSGFYAGCVRNTDTGCDSLGAPWEFQTEPEALLVRVHSVFVPEVGDPFACENNAGGPGERVMVEVYYNYRPLTPFFVNLFPRIRIHGQMEMINEGFGPTGASHGGVLPPPIPPPPPPGAYPSVTLFTDSDGNEVDQYTLGEDLIYVTVIDKDENFYLDQIDTIPLPGGVVVSDSSTGDSEALALTETGINAGVFRTVGLPSIAGPATPNNGVLETSGGYTIRADYTDDDDPTDTSFDTARMIGEGTSNTRFTDSGGTDVMTYTIEVDDIFVTVEDADQNANSGVAEEVTVTISDTVTLDSETLTLTETGPNTGVFCNSGAPLASSSNVGFSGDTILNTGFGNRITVAYRDPTNPGDTSSDSAVMVSPPTNSTTRFTDNDGVDVDEYAIGATGADGIYVTVDDTDENTGSLTRQEISVTITDGATGDSETLTLTETGPSTGIFRNETPLPSGQSASDNPGNDFLETQDGSTITVEYTDVDGGDTSNDTAQMLALPTASTTSFTDSGGVDVNVYNIGVDEIYVTVQDGDENEDSGVADTVSVTITDETGDSETLILTETGLSTGVFRNTTGLQSTTGTVSVGDNMLQTQPGNTITVTYTDEDPVPVDNSTDTASMGTTSATRLTDSGGAELMQYAIGVESIFVTVTDSDENADSGLIEEVTVTVADSVTGDSETLTLRETGVDTGIFRNLAGLPSSTSSGSSGNGTLNTANGSTITATYVDPDGEADTSFDTATMIIRTPSVTSFTDNLGADLEEYYLGTQLIYVTVEDADENLNPSVAETISVAVRDDDTGDSETLTLYETGANTGIFRGGGLASAQGAANLGNNLLETQPGNTITASYTDDDDGTDTSEDTAQMRPSDQPPDLVVTNIEVEEGSTNPALGELINVTVTVRNQNMGSVTSTLFDVDFYIYTSPDNPPVPGRPGDAKQWCTENVPGGSEIQLVYPISLTQAGTLYLYAQADTTGRVAEADETNNIYLLEVPYVTLEVGCDAVFYDDMESAGANGWTHSADPCGGCSSAEFTKVGSDSHSGSQAWWVDDVTRRLRTYLISPQIFVPGGLTGVQLRFWHRVRVEANYDGGWLEYRIDSEPNWHDVTPDMIVLNGYNGVTANTIPSSIVHDAWTATFFWQEVAVNIPAAAIGHNIQFRWHFECDPNDEVGDPDGWWIDDVLVGSCAGPSPDPPPGSEDCVTVFQDDFSGGLSQWNRSSSRYVYISPAGRLTIEGGSGSEPYANTRSNVNLSGYSYATLSYSWWTGRFENSDYGRMYISTDGGGSWPQQVAEHRGGGTANGTNSVTLSGGQLSNQFRLRVASLANQGNEYFQVDNIVLEACNVVDPPDPVAGTGNIFGHTFYESPAWPVPFPISGVNIWATCTDCVPPEDAVYTYSLDDYSYGFWNLPEGLYTIYADIIINGDLYTDLITDVAVTEYSTTAVDIYVTY